jgi:hypothetical protein
MVMKLIEQNTELQKQIIELAKHPGVVNNTQNIMNNTNNQFNLNVFLNETCKDALNIDDFMDSLHLTVDDLEETGRLGFVQGMTRIFLQGLKDLDITRRPFHCTDIKRETVYVKDQNKWEKETTDKKLMKQALNQVVRKNLKMIHVWREDHPDYLRSNTKDNDEYMKISVSSLGSEYDDEQRRMDEKIIRNVLKDVVIDKNEIANGDFNVTSNLVLDNSFGDPPQTWLEASYSGIGNFSFIINQGQIFYRKLFTTDCGCENCEWYSYSSSFLLRDKIGPVWDEVSVSLGEWAIEGVYICCKLKKMSAQ